MLRSFAVALVFPSLVLVTFAQFSTMVHGVERLLLIEDFDDLELMEAVNENIAPEILGWTHEPPPGWQIANFGAGFVGDLPGVDDPDNGVEEWEGWSFTTEEFWLSADEQRRSEFFLDADGKPILRGGFAVADPDEWDDLGDPEADLGNRPCPLCGPYNTFLATPEIDITAVTPGTMQLSFDSSWRPECDSSCQRVEVLANYDNGESITILNWTSDPASPDFHDDNSTNESLSFAVPAASNDADAVQFFFNMLDAGNDWWWAIDDVVVTGDVPDVVGLDCDFDDDGFCNGTDIDLLGKDIIAGTNDATFDMNGDGAVDLADQDMWLTGAATENGFAARYLNGDANLDGSVDSGDLNVVGINWNGTPDPWSDGDFNADGTVNAGDLNILALNWQQSVPQAADGQTVPEPSTLALLTLAGMALVLRRRR